MRRDCPPPPCSCDTLVILPEADSGLPVCFGKNSDRPSHEEHKVIYVPRRQHSEGSCVLCTYIEVPEVSETWQVVLSKPRWMWGCEMGANEHGVVGGNEAVRTNCQEELGSQRRLLGMDLLRLALERGRSAREAVEICARLLEAHGQGGGCAEGDGSWTYENGFLFADGREAFVMETAGVSWWAVERVASGSCRNISNGISIRTDIHSIHAGLKNHCQSKGWWDGMEPFDFKRALSGGPSHAELQLCGRERAGHDFLASLSADSRHGIVKTKEALARRMMDVLRDEDSGICFRTLHSFNSTGSQVSLLPGDAGCHNGGGEHYFTCASDPKVVPYKRFEFSQVREGSAQRIAAASLELWRLHRKRALSRQEPKNMTEIESAAFAGSGALLQLLEAEISLLSEG